MGRDGEMLELWKQVFGEMWDLMSSTDATLGAYLVNTASADVMLDENIKRILGIDDSISSEDFVNMIESLKSDMKIHSPIKVYEKEIAGKEIFGGFVRLDKVKETALSEMFSMSSQTQLIALMRSDAGDSMLAFVKLEGIPTSYYSAQYVQSAMSAIVQELPMNAMLASNSKNLFWIFAPGVRGASMELKLLQKIRSAVEHCEVMDEFGVRLSVQHEMTITAGTANISKIPTERMHTANFSLYEALGVGIGSIVRFSKEQYEAQNNGYMEIRRFTRLVEENRFVYHFQPIVSVETGEIIAYEMLMRSDEGIGLGPLDILRIAERTSRLQDIEHATFFNAMAYLNEHQVDFGGKKLFVNSITGHSMSDADFSMLEETYGELLEKIVVELTEQSEVNDESLNTVQARLKQNRMQMAIDDYGSGYSNTSNLIRYNPSIVKIDRSLISGIDTNQRTRKIVESIIGFLHNSGFVALAEGVETREELQTMIMLGADLIQGYYTARPRPVLLHEISSVVKAEIEEFRNTFSGEHMKLYYPTLDEVVKLEELVAAKYTGIIIDTERVTLRGKIGKLFPLPVTIKDSLECEINLKNAGISTPYDFGCVALGNHCKVHMICEGENILDAKGIYVPGTSEFHLSGSGRLTIQSQQLNCYGIGTPMDEPYGKIILDMNGHLDIVANGDNVVGIGGSKASETGGISIIGSACSVVCHGRKCVAIGGFTEAKGIILEKTGVSIEMSAPDCVAIGCYTGEIDVSIQNFRAEINCAGHNLVGVGVMDQGIGKVDISRGKMFMDMRGRKITCIGTRGGKVDYTMYRDLLELKSEGDEALGIGDLTGNGDIHMSEVDVNLDFSVGTSEEIKTNGTCSITAGSRTRTGIE